MFFNKKGIALVILIVAMTLIAILGASMVSFMVAKQREFVFQLNSYRALNIANAGVEYAIRYVGDNIDPTGNNLNDFFHSPTSHPNIKVVSTPPDTSNLNDTSQWKRFDFDNGQFYISLYLDPNLSSLNDSILYSVGVKEGAQRIVKLTKYLQYATPTFSAGLDKLNLVPNINRSPYIANNYVVIPVLNLTTSNITISSIQFEANLDNNLTKEFTDLYISDTQGEVGTNIYDVATKYYPDTCPGPLPCKWGWPNYFIEIPDNGPVTKPLNVSAGTVVPASSIRWFSMRFNESGSNLKGIYSITFNFSGGGSSTVKFRV